VSALQLMPSKRYRPASTALSRRLVTTGRAHTEQSCSRQHGGRSASGNGHRRSGGDMLAVPDFSRSASIGALHHPGLLLLSLKSPMGVSQHAHAIRGLPLCVRVGCREG
jgi:hypothetical protein